MKSNIWIGIGVGVIAIAGVCYAYKKFVNKKETVDEKKYQTKEENHEVKEKSNVDICPVKEEKSTEDVMKDFYEEKSDKVKDIMDRHENASEIMRESLEHIKSEQTYTESENTETLDDMNDQLDELMK